MQEGVRKETHPGWRASSGRMRLVVGDKALGVLDVDNGHVKLVPDGGAVDVTAVWSFRATPHQDAARRDQSSRDGAAAPKGGCRAIANVA